MAITYTPIATYTAPSAQASIAFSSLGAYTDIRIIVQAKGTNTTNTDLGLRFNSDTGTNYSRTGIYGDGTDAGSFRVANETSAKVGILPGTTNGNWGAIRIDLQNYANTSIYKTLIARGDEAGTSVGLANAVLLWRATPAAITSITFIPISGNIATGSTFTLYGILKA